MISDIIQSICMWGSTMWFTCVQCESTKTFCDIFTRSEPVYSKIILIVAQPYS